MVDTLTLNNNGTAAWEVTTFSGAGITTQIGVTNPDIELTGIGTRYEIYNDGYPNHPLEFLDDQDNALLSQSSTGSFESDSGVNWVDNDTYVEFTLTQGLSNQLTTYRCTVHSGAMVGNIISPVIDYTPNTGSVSITSPADGDIVTSPFDVVMSATNFTVEAASNPATDGAGHLHILVDQPAVAPGQAIPNNPANGYYHYGDGSTTATLDLDPGATTIRIQAGTSNHLAYDLTDSVDIIVESGVESTPVIEALNNVNQTSLETLFGAIAADPVARDNLSRSNRNIDKVAENIGVIEALDAEEDAILRLLCRRENRDPVNFATLADVASDTSLIRDLSVNQTTLDIITYSTKADSAISADDLASREFICHPVGLDASTFTDVADLITDGSAISSIAADEKASAAATSLSVAMQELTSSQSSMQAAVAEQAFVDRCVVSKVAMDSIANSAVAMQEMINEPVALSAMADTEISMSRVAGSSTAASEVANSLPALDVIANNALVQNTLYNNNTSVTALSNSNLLENGSANARWSGGATIKNDKCIVINSNSGSRGFRSNSGLFGAGNNSFPQTANRIGRGSNYNGNRNGGTSLNATFIDLTG